VAIAVFDYGAWSALYPDLAAKVAQPQALAYFNQAGSLYVDNTDDSVIYDVNVRLQLLYLAVAHLAQINLPASAGGTGIVGRVSGATEGSVSVQSELNVPGSAAWFAQTQAGLSLWQALAPYRTAHYVPGPTPTFDPFGPGGLLGTQHFGGSLGLGRWPW
jgi:hypothetical protein